MQLNHNKIVFIFSATHLLNACTRQITNCVTYQKSSSVTANNLKLELGILGKKIDKKIIEDIQDLVR